MAGVREKVAPVTYSETQQVRYFLLYVTLQLVPSLGDENNAPFLTKVSRRHTSLLPARIISLVAVCTQSLHFCFGRIEFYFAINNLSIYGKE